VPQLPAPHSIRRPARKDRWAFHPTLRCPRQSDQRGFGRPRTTDLRQRSVEETTAFKLRSFYFLKMPTNLYPTVREEFRKQRLPESSASTLPGLFVVTRNNISDRRGSSPPCPTKRPGAVVPAALSPSPSPCGVIGIEPETSTLYFPCSCGVQF
jgi:hypothetical protein